MTELISNITNANPKQKVKISKYELTDKTAIFNNDDWILSSD
jgi:hypothetical protein